MYLQYKRPLLFITFFRMFGRRRRPSARPSSFRFRIDRPITWISKSIVLYRFPPSGEEIVIAWIHIG